MNFLPLEKLEQLEEIKKSESYSVIFKDNINCPISRRARTDLENQGEPVANLAQVYKVDLFGFPQISKAVTESFSITHESPQVLLIKNGKCIYNASHYDISSTEIEEEIKFISNGQP